MSEIISQKSDYLFSVVCPLPSVLLWRPPQCRKASYGDALRHYGLRLSKGEPRPSDGLGEQAIVVSKVEPGMPYFVR